VPPWTHSNSLYCGHEILSQTAVVICVKIYCVAREQNYGDYSESFINEAMGIFLGR